MINNKKLSDEEIIFYYLLVDKTNNLESLEFTFSAIINSLSSVNINAIDQRSGFNFLTMALYQRKYDFIKLILRQPNINVIDSDSNGQVPFFVAYDILKNDKEENHQENEEICNAFTLHNSFDLLKLSYKDPANNIPKLHSLGFRFEEIFYQAIIKQNTKEISIYIDILDKYPNIINLNYVNDVDGFSLLNAAIHTKNINLFYYLFNNELTDITLVDKRNKTALKTAEAVCKELPNDKVALKIFNHINKYEYAKFLGIQLKEKTLKLKVSKNSAFKPY